MIDNVPRLLVGPARGQLWAARADWFDRYGGARMVGWSRDQAAATDDLRLVARFDQEWRRFAAVGSAEQKRLFDLYFDVVPAELLAAGRVVVDVGCGAGRWAFAVSQRGPRVIAVDLGRSVELAESNTRATGRVACIQADARDLPLAPRSVDLAYSVGVLHHVLETEQAVNSLASVTRPGGGVLLYLYYALDNRGPLLRTLFVGVNWVRRATVRLPHRLLVPITGLIAALVYLPLARTAALLHRAGAGRLAEALPLSFYADSSFATMRNDSLDRFGTTLEKRYRREEVVSLLEGAGLVDVSVSDEAPYWHAVGRVPSGSA